MTWEYASTLTDGPATKDTLNALGADGWELVSVLQGAQTKQLLYVFKRVVATPPAAASETPQSAQQGDLSTAAARPELQF